jgi:hypothetical protein
MCMSKVDLNINLIHSTSSHTILCGEVNVSQPLPNSITCPPQCDYEDNHITLDKTVDKLFKDYFSKAPIYPRQFTTYDQAGFQISKYIGTRTNNMSGTVENGIEPRVLLSDIVFPQITSGQQFLILSSYTGLTSRNLDEQKKFIVTHDMEMFKSRYDLSQVIIFMVDTIEKEISPYCDLTKIFKEVHVKPIAKIIPSFVEYITGSIVSGSKPDFQGLLSFGSDVEISAAHFSPLESHLNATIRRNGRIHLATTSPSSSSHFVVLLSHPSPENIEIRESTTVSKYELVLTPNETFSVSELQLQTMMNGMIFLKELEKFTGEQSFVQYLLSDPVKVVTYLVDSPILKVFKYNRESLPRLDYMITNYMLYVQSQIHDKLVSYGSPPQPPPMYYHRGGNVPPPVPMGRQVSEYTSHP